MKTEIDEIVAGIDQRKMLEDVESDRRRAANPIRQKQLEILQTRRNSGAKPAVIGSNGGWGFSAVMIPPLDMQVILTMYPELNSKDKATHDRAWRKFINSPVAAPYRTDDSIGKKQRFDGIIIR